MPIPTDEDVEAKARELFEAEREPDRSWDDMPPGNTVGAPKLRPLTEEEKEVYFVRAREELGADRAI